MAYDPRYCRCTLPQQRQRHCSGKISLPDKFLGWRELRDLENTLARRWMGKTSTKRAVGYEEVWDEVREGPVRSGAGHRDDGAGFLFFDPINSWDGESKILWSEIVCEGFHRSQWVPFLFSEGVELYFSQHVTVQKINTNSAFVSVRWYDRALLGSRSASVALSVGFGFLRFPRVGEMNIRTGNFQLRLPFLLNWNGIGTVAAKEKSAGYSTCFKLGLNELLATYVSAPPPGLTSATFIE
ncbi:hypothetical protein C8R45DRAFT_934609 [Mycena sanguinolenta]|nr:hypothetical protein C8R45DRAFT_934609 [Mycena sanguinolenta]